MRRTSETTELSVRKNVEDNSSLAPKPSGTSDSEEWVWMVDEDPAFYLSNPEGA